MSNLKDTSSSLNALNCHIDKLLSHFNEAAFICYSGQLWMNAPLCQMLNCDNKQSLSAVVPSNMHHLLSQPGNQQFDLELNGNRKAVTARALLSPYQVQQYKMTLGLIMNTPAAVASADIFPSPKIEIISNDLPFEHQKASVTLEAISDGIISIDHNGYIDYLNTSAELMLGIAASDVLERKLNEVLTLEDAVSGLCVQAIAKNFKQKPHPDRHSQELLIKHKSSGFLSPVDIFSSPIKDNAGNIAGTVLVIHDISDLQYMSEQILFQAKHDSLTGLFNRGEFERQLLNTLDRLQQSDETHVMCYIDLDQFKTVNDSCGHLAGDALLKQISAHIKSHTKDRDIVGRLGGDEFGLLLKDCDMNHARNVTERIRQAVKSHQFKWDNKTFRIGASIGVMVIDKNSGTLDDIMSTVDSACYSAKQSGRDQVNFISKDNELILKRQSEAVCVEKIKHALAKDGFQLYTQSIAPLDASIEHGGHQELLLRMCTADNKMLNASDFINTAQRYHMMADIDRWVIQHALLRLSDSEDALNDENIELTCINISSQSLSDDTFTDDVIQYLKNSPVPAQKICFEISENAVASDIIHATEFMQKLSAIGVHFSLDNFCNSLSSFSYIKNLPIDFLKIDGRFMHNLIEDAVDSALISAIRDITNILGIQTIAESVEDQYTYNALKTLGIDYAQGFYISRPKDLLQQYEQSLSAPLNIQ
ncbi:MAG: EAL domain-containing protein [Gammaproteobacteria bacterium]|nr:EAL domain-containing protein [Gammaproteobacteria bacterium]